MSSCHQKEITRIDWNIDQVNIQHKPLSTKCQPLLALRRGKQKKNSTPQFYIISLLLDSYNLRITATSKQGSVRVFGIGDTPVQHMLEMD